MPLYEEYDAHAARRSGLAFAPGEPGTRVVDDHVLIDAAADGDVDAVAAELSALGLRDMAVAGHLVSGRLPLVAIPALDRIAGLRFARPSMATRHVGSVTSQGDAAMRSDRARSVFGVDGAGVKVGVLSDSFDCLGGAAEDIANGDLVAVTVLQELAGCDDATDEGRAMLQIVHDVAPGAALSFASAFNGIASFANNIVALKNNGAKVILDDIIYFNEPMFQDGVIAQAVDTVVAQGVAYFSAAGNEDRRAYESPFRAGTTFPSCSPPPPPTAPPCPFTSAPGAGAFLGGVAHNFATSGPADHLQQITIPAGRTLVVSLQWDSPFFSVSGGPGSANDLDLYLLNGAGTMVVRRSVTNNVGGDAVEVLTFTNNGATATFNLMIVKFGSGPVPAFMKYVQLGSGTITIVDFNTSSGALFGHPNAVGAAAVGAVLYTETPQFGVTPPLKEPFSSSGPTPILFNTAGVRLAAPVIRAKPDLMAPDGVSTTLPGNSGLNPFFGSSAAAPHAGGVAALLLQRQPALPPTGVYDTLRTTAIDMAAPGFDFDTGFGLIQADAALQLLSGPITLGLTLDRTTVAPGQRLRVSTSIANAGGALSQDLYFLILVPPALSVVAGCPAGDAIIFLSNDFNLFTPRCAGSSSPATFPALTQKLFIPASSATSTPEFYSLVWPSGLPAGTYGFALVTTLPESLTDGRIGPVDISAIAVQQFQATP
jgi:subtilisin family serine protease